MNFIRKIVTQSSKGDDEVFYNAMRNLLEFTPKKIIYYQKAFNIPPRCVAVKNKEFGEQANNYRRLCLFFQSE